MLNDPCLVTITSFKALKILVPSAIFRCNFCLHFSRISAIIVSEVRLEKGDILMGNYAVPEEIRKMRPMGTTVKNIKGHFYVYEYTPTSIKIEAEDGTVIWKSKTKSGPCIGYITLEEGFVRNAGKLGDSSITVFEFGNYFLIKELAVETMNQLKDCFNVKEANQIFTVASIFVVEKFQYMKRIAEIREHSVLSLWYPDVKVGKDALSTLYGNLGRHGTIPEKFQQALIDNSSKKVAIDGHVIACSAESTDLSAFGYKAKKLGAPQINWMTAYDVETKLPLCNEMFNGSDPDKTAVETLFSRFHFENTLFLVDRGFNTSKDKALFSSNGNAYIVPMISGRDDYEAVYKALKFDKRKSFVYDKDGYSSQIRYETYVIGDDPVHYFAFLDTTRQSAERQTYIRKLSAGKKGYTQEGLLASEKDFGLFLLETNDLNKTAQEVFCDYKSRLGIETFYNSIDNTLDFNALYQNDYCSTQGLGFIVQVAGMIFHDIQKAIGEKGLSVKDTMFIMKGLKQFLSFFGPGKSAVPHARRFIASG